MKFIRSKIKDAWIIEPLLHQDGRGFFCETWSERDFKIHGINSSFRQGNLSYNKSTGTLRGLHFQAPPHQENKLIRVTKGSIFDVIVDIRPDSPTFKQWEGFLLDDLLFRMVYVPQGCAHGYQTLQDHTYVSYEVSELYQPESARSLRWDDTTFKIEWPNSQNPIISPKDLKNPLWS